MSLIVVTSSVLLVAFTAADKFYNFGVPHGDIALPKGFLERSDRIRLRDGCNFLGDRIYYIWVSPL